MNIEDEVKLLGEKRKRKFGPGQDFRVRLNQGLFKRSSPKLEAMLGCTLPEFREHLSKQFQPGMTFAGYSQTWCFSFVKPFRDFDLTRESARKECFHFSNVRVGTTPMGLKRALPL